MLRILLCALLLLTQVAHAEYLWHASPERKDDLASRFVAPPGTRRVAVAGFGAWLRHLPLLPAGTPVRLFDGRAKSRQDVHAAVIDLDVGRRDLQQCADAVMRLRAEFLRARGEPIAFHPDPGKPRAISWRTGESFEKFLVKLFADAGTASLAAELPRREKGAIEPGDVLIQGGHPGHAVLVLDAVERDDGTRLLLLGQSYMPAQQFHVLQDPDTRSPWFAAALLDGAGLKTPEWPAFFRRDVRRFPANR